MSFERAKALAQVRVYGQCEGCGARRDLDPHHRMTRGMGGVHRAGSDVSNDVRNLLMLCRYCHDQTLTAAADCIALGWVVERRAGVDPRTIPAKIHTVNGYGWWRLREDGGYDWDDAANLDPFYSPIGSAPIVNLTELHTQGETILNGFRHTLYDKDRP